MSLLTLRESLSRAKNKWKDRFGISLGDPNPSANSPGSRRNRALSPGVRSLLRVLDSGSEVFGPLKSAIDGLGTCFSLYEGLSKERKDLAKLHAKIDGMLQDLAEFMSSSTGYVMTGSVKLICLDLEEEVKVVEKSQARSTGRALTDALDGYGNVLDGYRRVQDHLERLALNLNLSIMKSINEQTAETKLANLSPSMSAVYNSAESDSLKRGRCTQGTREPQIKLLLDWARTPEAGKTCWMNGMAGTGKTTIAYSVCHELDNKCALGASFFCSRVVPECRQVKHIIPSIVYQLARFSLPFRCELVKALESDPDAGTRALNVQYKKLIVNPLEQMQKSLPTNFIVVIDALDECDNEDSVGKILDLILSPAYTLPIRFLVSSRPEREITRCLGDQLGEQGDTRLVLHDLASEGVRADIETYIRHELNTVPLTSENWSNLVEACGVLFIYASTTCRYVKQAYAMGNLNGALSMFLAVTSPEEKEETNAIDQLYLTILETAFNNSAINPTDRKKMWHLLETVICAIEPMTMASLALLLEMNSTQHVEALLQPLRSVLNVTKGTKLVATLHASFPDFMLSRPRSGSFCCKPALRHATIAENCLRVVNTTESKFNICRLPSSYMLDNSVERLHELVSQDISPGLSYACRHWSAHLHLGEYRSQLMDLVRIFFFERLLLWMEVLNLTDSMIHGAGILQEAERWCNEHAAPDDVSKIADDAWQFASVYANHPVSQSTPHIYVSMLPFWPQSRPVSVAYRPRTVGLIEPAGSAITRRQLALLATFKVSNKAIGSMSLSTDGTRLVAACQDSIELLDTSTGNSVLSLTDLGTISIDSVAISPDGTRIAYGGQGSALYLRDLNISGTVTEPFAEHGSGVYGIAFSPDGLCVACGLGSSAYICSLQEGGRVLGPLQGHTNRVTSVAFAPNSLQLATGSWDKTIRVWDAETGHMVGGPFEGHTNWVHSFCYSPDGSRLASSSYDGTIRVWDPQTGQTILGPLTGHSDWVKSVTFSSNGCFIASASADNTITIYHAQTGQPVLGPLAGHTSWVNSVMFSPDNVRLYSCSNDGTIRIWNIQDLDVSHNPRAPVFLLTRIYSVRYSHRGLRVASGSEDGTIHVWDAQTGEMVLEPLRGHTNWVVSIDYSPNDAYIASASLDGTLRIWDAYTGKDLHGPLRSNGGDFNCVRISPDGSVVASGSDSGAVQLWDVTSGQLITDPFKHDSHIYSVAFSPDGRQVVAGSGDGTIFILDQQTGDTLIDPINAGQTRVYAVELSPDGSRILTCSLGQSIQIWDAQTGQHILTGAGSHLDHCRTVRSAAFSPDGRHVVSGAEDGTICVWDAQSGKLVSSPPRRHTSSVRSVQFSPDGTHVVSCSPDCTIRFWDVSSCKQNPQSNVMVTDADGDESGSSGLHCDDTINSWSLNKDGWVVDPQGRRLIWVPSDLWGNLACLPNDLIIADRGCLMLKFDGARLGEDWVQCYRP